MITVASLKNYSLKDLAQLARKSGIDGWQSMRKEQLIRALGKTVKTGNKEQTGKNSGSGKSGQPSKIGPGNRTNASKASATKASPGKAGAEKPSASKMPSTKTAATKTTTAKPVASKSTASKLGIAKTEASKVVNESSGGKGGPGKSAAQAASARAGTKSTSAKPAASARAGGTKSENLKVAASKTSSVKSTETLATDSKAGQAREAAKNDLAKGASKSSSTGKPSTKAAPKSAEKKPPEKPRMSQASRRIQRANEERERRRDLSQPAEGKSSEGQGSDAQRDRVVLIVRDPYWLQATWEVTRQSVLRAQAAMAEQWHTARPILRLLEIESSGTTSSAERVLREIPIHGGVHNWYIDVIDPPKGYRVELGYLGANGKFFAITRSNTVTTPRPGSADSIDENWSDVEQNFERIFAQSGGYSEETSSHELQEAIEERLQRPIGPPISSRFGVGAERILRRRRDFQFDVDAEMVVHGQTKPDAHVTLSGEPVKLRDDGSFAVRMALPDKRQVIPVVASSRDGGEQRTIVIAVERNTKVMEPMIRETND